MNEPSAKPDELIENTQWQTAPPPPGPRTPPNWRAIGAVAIAVVLLVIVALWVRRYIRGRGRLVTRWTIGRPNRKAIKALRALERRLRDDADGRFVPDLSDVVRVYVQERFGLRAPHRSTEEFLREAAGSELLTDDHCALLADFLTRADRVKFARAEAGYELRKGLLDAGKNFVTGTDPSSMPWLTIQRRHLQEA